jgi:hypothetical protein
MFRDQDLDSCYDVQPNATCTDCGADYSRGEDDPTTHVTPAAIGGTRTPRCSNAAW